MTDKVDAIVIGAGVVGLATARALAMKGLETILVEKEAHYGQGVSSRSSEVIHAGLYYRPGSLKAQLCRPGRELLYEYCASRHVPHRQTGKWVVACQTDQEDQLAAIHDRALLNGCDEVYMMNLAKARTEEPELRAQAVLVSPRTGIIDSHALMTALLGDFEAAGGTLACGTEVVSIDSAAGEHLIRTRGESEFELRSSILVNSAGLQAVPLAQHLSAQASCFTEAGLGRGMHNQADEPPPLELPAACYAKGQYYSLSGRSPFSRLIYPVPEKGGLGVHLTLDLQGRARFGPDVQWIDEINYIPDDHRKAHFVKAIQSYWPGCPEDRLSPDYAGVRPKLGSQEMPHDDFLILGPKEHGLAGLVHLLGIESPGLTACLALALQVSEQLGVN